VSNVDWLKIRLEYETMNTSYRKIADKYGVSFNTLKGRAKRENWAKSKEETHHKITTKTLQKTVVKIAEKESNRNARILNLSDLAVDGVEEYFKETHYKKHVYKEKLYCGGKVDSEKITCKELGVADTKAFSNMVGALDKLQKGQRVAEGLDNKDAKNIQHENNEQITILADLLNSPVKDRQVQEFEEDE